jgi:hypothetical protein
MLTVLARACDRRERLMPIAGPTRQSENRPSWSSGRVGGVLVKAPAP